MINDIRKLDTLGRINIPNWIRASLRVETEARYSITLLPTGEIILKPIPSSCRICGSEENLRYWAEQEIHLCSSCCERLQEKRGEPPWRMITPYAALPGKEKDEEDDRHA